MKMEIERKAKIAKYKPIIKELIDDDFLFLT